ncbi:transposase [Carnobacterium maltaromaticum]|uniref:transposase n=1 Tax=Carnobacterium maltaromaticum TaxID=2751 RepID=UPI00295E8984|nr:transposase [Carnobacterium maltaromaticum]
MVVDMNAGYFTLAKELFPNAKVIIDRFHLVQLLTVALNKTRIQLMNQFKRWKPEEMKDYRKLKRYWKLLLQDSQKVNYTDYQYHRLFRKVMPHSEIVDYLLSLNSTLKATYTCYQDLLYAMSQNNSDLLKSVLSSPHEQVSDYMSTALQTLRKHEERIRNTFQSTRSNGPLEGSINKIKVIKRTAYGYTSFLNYKYRILISFQEKEKTI